MKKLIPIVVLLFFLACKKENGVPGPAGAAGPQGLAGNASTDTGSISGKLSLFDEFGYKKTDGSGAVVTITSGNLREQDTTAIDGSYQFSGLRTGTYNLSYEKSGYGNMKVFGVSHIPGGTVSTLLKEVYLLQIPAKTSISNFSISSNSIFYTTFTITLDTSSQSYTQYDQNFVILVGKKASVSLDNNVKQINQLFIPDGQGGYSNVVDKSVLTNSFHTGDTMYFAAFTYNRFVYVNPPYMFDTGDQASYIDPSTGAVVYPNMSLFSTVLKAVY